MCHDAGLCPAPLGLAQAHRQASRQLYTSVVQSYGRKHKTSARVLMLGFDVSKLQFYACTAAGGLQ